MIYDYFILALKNLRQRGLRSWLTMLGIFIGIAAVVSLISLGQGLQGAITEQFEQLGSDKILIQAKTLGPPGSTDIDSLILKAKDLELIRNINGVDEVVGALVRSSPVTYGKETEVVMVIGIDEEYLDMFSTVMEPIEGRLLKDDDKFKAVVGYNNAFGDMWRKSLGLRDNFEIQDVEFKVIGVEKKIGNPYDDAAVLIQKDSMREVFDIPDEESQIVVKVKEGYDPIIVADNIKEKLRKSRGEREDQETFTITTSEQIMQSFSTIFGIVQGVIIGIAAISLLVGGIGIMNTMYTSVLERTKEIGIMKAIGAKNSDIMLIFLFESGLLGLVGGAIGIAIGYGLGKSAGYIASSLLGTSIFRASFPPALIFGALAFSIIIGSASGILPAMQAAKLKPTQALRYE